MSAALVTALRAKKRLKGLKDARIAREKEEAFQKQLDEELMKRRPPSQPVIVPAEEASTHESLERTGSGETAQALEEEETVEEEHVAPTPILTREKSVEEQEQVFGGPPEKEGGKLNEGAKPAASSPNFFPAAPSPPKAVADTSSRVGVFYHRDFRVQMAIALLIAGNFLSTIAEKQVWPSGDPRMPGGQRHARIFKGLECFFNLVFTVELVANFAATGACAFWRSSWNVFDFLTVFTGWLFQFNLPLPKPLRLMRMVRALRVFRLFKRVESLRRILEALARAVPGVVHVFIIMAITMSIYAILAVDFFRNKQGSHTDNDHHYWCTRPSADGGAYLDATNGLWSTLDEFLVPATKDFRSPGGPGCPAGWRSSATTLRGNDYGHEYFGNFWKALFTMFQVVTGDSWAESIARPLMANSQNTVGTGVFFVTFILLHTVILMNVVIGNLVQSLVFVPEAEDEEIDFEWDAACEMRLEQQLQGEENRLKEAQQMLVVAKKRNSGGFEKEQVIAKRASAAARIGSFLKKKQDDSSDDDAPSYPRGRTTRGSSSALSPTSTRRSPASSSALSPPSSTLVRRTTAGRGSKGPASSSALSLPTSPSSSLLRRISSGRGSNNNSSPASSTPSSPASPSSTLIRRISSGRGISSRPASSPTSPSATLIRRISSGRGVSSSKSPSSTPPSSPTSPSSTLMRRLSSGRGIVPASSPTSPSTTRRQFFVKTGSGSRGMSRGNSSKKLSQDGSPRGTNKRAVSQPGSPEKDEGASATELATEIEVMRTTLAHLVKDHDDLLKLKLEDQRRLGTLVDALRAKGLLPPMNTILVAAAS